MGRLMRFRRGTPYRKFGSESSLLVPEQPNNKEQVYNCSQCGHEGTIKSVSTYLLSQLYKLSLKVVSENKFFSEGWEGPK